VRLLSLTASRPDRKFKPSVAVQVKPMAIRAELGDKDGALDMDLLFPVPSDTGEPRQ
jgi:hypothetical protein